MALPGAGKRNARLRRPSADKHRRNRRLAETSRRGRRTAGRHSPVAARHRRARAKLRSGLQADEPRPSVSAGRRWSATGYPPPTRTAEHRRRSGWRRRSPAPPARRARAATLLILAAHLYFEPVWILNVEAALGGSDLQPESLEFGFDSGLDFRVRVPIGQRVGDVVNDAGLPALPAGGIPSNQDV